MNRFNNKKYYKPPPVKPSNRLREKPKEEWNPYQNDLNKYKLSNAEILKKKINATSKNLEEAKRDWQGQIAMIQNGKIKMNFDDDFEGKQKIIRKKIDLTPMNRFEKRLVNIDAIRNNDRNAYQNNRMNRPYSGYEDNYRNKGKKNNNFGKKGGNTYYNNNDNFQQNNSQENNFYDDEDDDGEIKMIYNTGDNANVIETKIKKENNLINYNNDISNNAAFNEFEKTIQKMQEHLQQKNEKNENNLEIKQNDFNIDNENNMIQKKNNHINNNTNNKNNLNKKQNKKINKKISNFSNNKAILNNEDFNPKKNKQYQKTKNKKEDNKIIDDLKKDINNKFKNLEGINELDNCMKQLDLMIEKSKEKSMLNRLNDEPKDEQFYRSENENFYQNNKMKKKIKFLIKKKNIWKI